MNEEAQTVYVWLKLDDEYDTYGVYVGIYSSLEKAKVAITENYQPFSILGDWIFKDNVGVLGAYDALCTWKTDPTLRRIVRILPQKLDMWEKLT